MFSPVVWDRWRCLHACTMFFRIAADAVEHLVPEPLVVKRDRDGCADIELGYVRFRANVHGLPPTEELAWAIAVERVRGVGFAFFAMNIGASDPGFLDYNREIGFRVHPAPLRFDVDVEAQRYRVEDERGQLICSLRHHGEGSVPTPFFPVSTEVWTQQDTGALQRRLFKWSGPARIHVSPLSGCTLTDHAFFGGARLTRARPIPAMVFSSTKTARDAAQLFTAPEEHDFGERGVRAGTRRARLAQLEAAAQAAAAPRSHGSAADPEDRGPLR